MPARPPPSIVMLQIVMRPSIESASIASPANSTTCAAGAVDAHLADRAEDQVLRGDARCPARPRSGCSIDLGLRCTERLRREHVLDLGGADAERQRAERAVRRGVAVAADDRHARLRHAELGADDVHDALAVGAQRVDRHAELRAVGLERLDLLAAELVLDQLRGRRAVGRRVVVGRRERAVGPAHRASGEAQAVEGLRAGDLVHEVQVDVDEAVGDLVEVPDLVEQGLAASGTAQSRRHDGEQDGLLLSGVLEMVGQVGVEGDGVAGLQVEGLVVDVQRRAAALDASRPRGCRARASAGRRGRRSPRRARACGG